MPAPSSLPEWATSGGADIVEPNLSRKQTGWERAKRPSAPYFNWWMNLVYDWIVWLDSISGGTGAFTPSTPDWAPGGGSVTSLTIDGAINEIIDDLAAAVDSTDNGANRIGVVITQTWASGATIAATDVHGAIAEIVSDLASSSGADKIGGSTLATWKDGSTIAGTNVNDILEEIVTELAADGAADGAGRVGYDDNVGSTDNVAGALEATFRTNVSQIIATGGEKIFQPNALKSKASHTQSVVARDDNGGADIVTETIVINMFDIGPGKTGSTNSFIPRNGIVPVEQPSIHQDGNGSAITEGVIPLHLPKGCLLKSMTVRYICPAGQAINADVLRYDALTAISGGSPAAENLGSATGNSTTVTNLSVDVSPDHRIPSTPLHMYYLRLSMEDASIAGAGDIFAITATVDYDSLSGLQWNPFV